MARMIHTIPGLPDDVYTVRERGNRFTPLIRGKNLMSKDGNGWCVASFDNLKDAINCVNEFLIRMQG